MQLLHLNNFPKKLGYFILKHIVFIPVAAKDNVKKAMIFGVMLVEQRHKINLHLAFHSEQALAPILKSVRQVFGNSLPA